MTEIELKNRATALMNRINALGFAKDGQLMTLAQACELVAAEEGIGNPGALCHAMKLPDSPSELQAVFDWHALTKRQGWSAWAQLIMCQLFISEQAKLCDLVAFAEKIAAEPNSRLAAPEQDPMVPTQEVISALQEIGYSVQKSDFGLPFWEFEDNASPDCVDEAAAWKDAWLDAQRRAVERYGMFAKDWDALPLATRIDKVCKARIVSLVTKENRCYECGQTLDLDGWDGRCGNCADRAEMQSADALARQLADQVYESYEFGATVADADGWETSTGSGVWTRTVFLEDPNPEYPSTRARFTVEIAGGKIVGAHLR